MTLAGVVIAVSREVPLYAASSLAKNSACIDVSLTLDYTELPPAFRTAESYFSTRAFVVSTITCTVLVMLTYTA